MSHLWTKVRGVLAVAGRRPVVSTKPLPCPVCGGHLNNRLARKEKTPPFFDGGVSVMEAPRPTAMGTGPHTAPGGKGFPARLPTGASVRLTPPPNPASIAAGLAKKFADENSRAAAAGAAERAKLGSTLRQASGRNRHDRANPPAPPSARAEV